jgi:hypothetical protein
MTSLLFGKAVTMEKIREEVTAYVRACECLLSPFDPPLNQDERDLIAYYVENLARRYEPSPSAKASAP